jgi:hypothetical protein
MSTHHRREGEAVGLLPTPRDRQSPGGLPMSVGDRPIAREDVWTLLAVAYLGADGRGAEPGSIGRLCRILRRPRPRSDRELRRSLGRLGQAGLVIKSGGLYRTPARVANFLRVRVHRRGIWHDYRDLMHHLGIV